MNAAVCFCLPCVRDSVVVLLCYTDKLTVIDSRSHHPRVVLLLHRGFHAKTGREMKQRMSEQNICFFFQCSG